MQVVFAIVVVLAGLVALWMAGWTKRRGDTIRTWPRAQGHVTSRQAVLQRVIDVTQGSSRERYYPEVRYTYSVEGTEYVGETIQAGSQTYGTRARTQKRLASIADEPQVYYDPADPKTSCLKPPGTIDAAFIGLVGLGFIAVGIVLAVK